MSTQLLTQNFGKIKFFINCIVLFFPLTLTGCATLDGALLQGVAQNYLEGHEDKFQLSLTYDSIAQFPGYEHATTTNKTDGN